MGGGTVPAIFGDLNVAGLSPRGRGNRQPTAAALPLQGSIPAWAGEPVPHHFRHVEVRVYPRVGGGTYNVATDTSHVYGLSPRGRGNPADQTSPIFRAGSIPAWAGEPRGGVGRPRLFGVYPRVGGGTEEEQEAHEYTRGLSPRGRGNLLETAPRLALPRSIPAWAGEPVRLIPNAHLRRVYPRVGRGNRLTCRLQKVHYGSIPAWAGNHPLPPPEPLLLGSIPAWAGEPPPTLRTRLNATVYPRVGGGTFCTQLCGVPVVGLSPRGRGNPSPRTARAVAAGSIPAWAGEPKGY